jgi:hypothetical protein
MAQYPAQPGPQLLRTRAVKPGETAMRLQERVLHQVRPAAFAPKLLGEVFVGDCEQVWPENLEDAPESCRIAALRGYHLRRKIDLATARTMTGLIHWRHCLVAAVAGTDQNGSWAAGPARGLETVQVFMISQPLVSESLRGVNKLAPDVVDLRRADIASFGFEAKCA